MKLPRRIRSKKYPEFEDLINAILEELRQLRVQSSATVSSSKTGAGTFLQVKGLGGKGGFSYTDYDSNLDYSRGAIVLVDEENAAFTDGVVIETEDGLKRTYVVPGFYYCKSPVLYVPYFEVLPSPAKNDNWQIISLLPVNDIYCTPDQANKEAWMEIRDVKPPEDP